MPGARRDSQADLRFVLANGRLAAATGDRWCRHLESTVALSNFIRIADEVAGLAGPGRVLDWGCSYGQVSYLLARRGLDMVGYDVGQAFQDPRLPMTRGLTAVSGEHPSSLPFDDASFETVLCCGVLEHVPDEHASLREIRRVLAPEGKLLIYNLPQKASYKEYVIRRLRLGPTHDRRYDVGSIRAVLRRNGFRLVRVRRGGVLPHMGTGLPPSVRRVYERFPGAVIAADRTLSQIPLLAQVAQSLEIVAEIRRGPNA